MKLKFSEIKQMQNGLIHGHSFDDVEEKEKIYEHFIKSKLLYDVPHKILIEKSFLEKDVCIVNGDNIYVKDMYEWWLELRLLESEFTDYDEFKDLAKNDRDRNLFPIFAKHEIEYRRKMKKYQ